MPKLDLAPALFNVHLKGVKHKSGEGKVEGQQADSSNHTHCDTGRHA